MPTVYNPKYVDQEEGQSVRNNYPAIYGDVSANWLAKHKKRAIFATCAIAGIAGVVAIVATNNRENPTDTNITVEIDHLPLAQSSHYDPTADIYLTTAGLFNGLVQCSKEVGDELFVYGNPLCSMNSKCFYFNQDAKDIKVRSESTTCVNCNIFNSPCHYEWGPHERLEFSKTCGTRCAFVENLVDYYSESCLNDNDCSKPWLQCRASGANYPNSDHSSEKRCLCNKVAFEANCASWDDETLLSASQDCKGVVCPGKALSFPPRQASRASIGERCATAMNDEFWTMENLPLCKIGLTCVVLPKSQYSMTSTPATECVDCENKDYCTSHDIFFRLAVRKACGGKAKKCTKSRDRLHEVECLNDTDCEHKWQICNTAVGKCECNEQKYLENCMDYTNEEYYTALAPYRSCKCKNKLPACPGRPLAMFSGGLFSECSQTPGDMYEKVYQYPQCSDGLTCIVLNNFLYGLPKSNVNTTCVDCMDLFKYNPVEDINVCTINDRYKRYDAITACSGADCMVDVSQADNKDPIRYVDRETCIVDAHCPEWRKCLPHQFYSLSCQCSWRHFQAICKSMDSNVLKVAIEDCNFECLEEEEIPNEAVVGESCAMSATDKSGAPLCQESLTCVKTRVGQECIDCNNIPKYCANRLTYPMTKACGVSCSEMHFPHRPFCELHEDCSFKSYLFCDTSAGSIAPSECRCNIPVYNTECQSFTKQEQIEAQEMYQCPPCGSAIEPAKVGEPCSVTGDDLFNDQGLGECEIGYTCMVAKRDGENYSSCLSCDSIAEECPSEPMFQVAFHKSCGKWCNPDQANACDSNMDCIDDYEVCVVNGDLKRCTKCWLPSFYIMCPSMDNSEREMWLKECNIPDSLLDPSTLECIYKPGEVPTEIPTMMPTRPLWPTPPPIDESFPTASPIKAPTFATRDERCSGQEGDYFSQFGYSKCEPGLYCVKTNYYSQCVDCDLIAWNEDCQFWKGKFLEAAQHVCGRYTCEPPSRADIDERCAVEVHDKFSREGYHLCRRGLECVVTASGYYSQCVDCVDNWIYDCPFWADGFLLAAESKCKRNCPPEANLEFVDDSCETDYDCSYGERCLSAGTFSRCISCEPMRFQQICSGWGPKVLGAAQCMCKTRCKMD